jgi:hypothetical protein
MRSSTITPPPILTRIEEADQAIAITSANPVEWHCLKMSRWQMRRCAKK